MQDDEQKLVHGIYSAIESLHLEWNVLIVYAEVQQGSYLVEFYAKDMKNRFVKCFDLTNVEESEMDDVLDTIGDQILDIWEQLPFIDQWSNMTLRFQNDGSFKIAYDYTDLKECAYEHHQKWKEKYLV